MNELVEVDPGSLHLPPSRRDGADPIKLQRQIAKPGKSTAGMPLPLVSRGKDGRMMILDGVTRATRVAKLLPGQSIQVQVVDEAPRKSYERFPTVRDRLP